MYMYMYNNFFFIVEILVLCTFRIVQYYKVLNRPREPIQIKMAINTSLNEDLGEEREEKS